ncbi:hypothetical protein DI272_30335 [Streptomyces sp. Act143]|uniref:hypothetical protein n=1 Tax=Streptomyces sp. Act143 TaxID=2200760 RepID=UPI000D6795C1|nr:hypothetical protein [Streptomyces sp. Act143]PWI17979.1 hypothetical protein DI272_30335 [Streptomyces sp. Act143]
MLLPEGFWVLFGVIVVAGLVATTAVAALLSTLTTGRTGVRREGTPQLSRSPRPSRPRRGEPAAVQRLPRPAQGGYPKAG